MGLFRSSGLVLAMALAAGCGGEIGDPISVTAGQIVDQQDGIQAYQKDVFVIVGSSLRNPDDTTALDAPLFNVDGVNLGLTWGQFSGANATSAAECLHDGTTDIKISFTNLIPGAVYSVFYGTLGPDSENPACPGVERTLPLDKATPPQCNGQGGDHDNQGHHYAYGHHHWHHHHGHHRHDHGNPDPGQPPANSACDPSPDFIAGADGTASFHAVLDGCLLDATQVFFSLVYHFDGHTYGTVPNQGESLTEGPMCRSSFGEDAMRQILILQKW